jgi:hypothetical protein
MDRLNGYRMKLVLIVLLIASAVSAFSGQTEDNETNSAAITAAGPRRGLVVVVEVTFPDRDALNELARAGYDISNVQGNIATLYASLEELERLKQTGYPLHEIEPPMKGFKPMALGAYHSYDALTDELSAYAESNPDICRLYTLGQSVQGRELWAILISDHPDEEEDEPEFKYVSTIHGDENLCTEICLYFIDLLLTEYGINERITNLIDSTAIWIVPLMNPDGLESGRRQNANGLDLNRSFPLLTDNSLNIFTGEPLDALVRQPEVRHIMNWTVENSFVLSAGFHTGALLVCYPYGYNEQMSAVDTPTPDDLLFEEISRRYSMYNLPMWNSSNWPDGIINSARWYPVIGEMADWNYRYASCNEVTIELSSNFRPSAAQIPTFWSQNHESMLSFLESVHIGVRGIVTERSSGEPLWAEILVEGNSHPVFTDPDVGDYHRMLLSGTYDLVFHVPGYLPRGMRNVIVADGPATRVDIELIPEQASPDFNHDKIVNIKDLEILIEYWDQDQALIDIAPLPDGDGIVDEQDLGLFMEFWQEEIPERGMIAHWPLDETEGMFAANSVGDNDASVVGGAVWQPSSGQVNGALELDSVGDYVITGPVLNPADGPFSIFAWVKGGTPGQVILSQAEGMNWLMIDPEQETLRTSLTQPAVNIRGKITEGPALTSLSNITDGNWHRVGLVRDGIGRILYVDDVEVARDTIENLESSAGGLYIGAGCHLGLDSFWSGMIDDVRIYNRVVTP